MIRGWAEGGSRTPRSCYLFSYNQINIYIVLYIHNYNNQINIWVGSIAVVHGFSCSTCGILPDQGLNVHVLCVDKWILYHWATRETSSSILGLPSGSVVQNLPASVEDYKGPGLIPGMGRSPGVWTGNPNSSILGASQVAQMVKNKQRV